MHWLRRLFHWGHRWQDTVYNRYYSPLEQRCECGAARHIIGLEDIKGEYPGVYQWREGRHPEYGNPSDER